MLSKQEKKRLIEALNRTFLDGYPNPERRGCPGPDVLKAVAFRRLGLEEAEPWIDHLSSCSPCTREFVELRHAFQQRQRLRLAGIAAGLIIVLVAAAWLFLRQPATRPVETATLDLTNRGALRGAEQAQPNPPLELGRGNLNLTMYLPVGSEPGMYEVEVVQQPGQPIWSAEAQVNVENYKSTLHVRVDLSHFKRGLYLLAIRQKDTSWSYYPLVLR